MSRAVSRWILTLTLALVLTAPLLADQAPRGVQQPQIPSDPATTVQGSPDPRAFQVGAQAGGALAARSCVYPYACPARCNCYDGDVAFCSFGGGQCKLDACELTACVAILK
ncbi:MAG: hypothetical protein ACOC92_01025 [bacterium]